MQPGITRIHLLNPSYPHFALALSTDLKALYQYPYKAFKNMFYQDLYRLSTENSLPNNSNN